MAIPILVVTSTSGFGDLIQQSLEETGRFRVLLVSSTIEAIECAGNMPFNLAILDSELEDSTLPELAQALQYLLPNLKLIVIPSDDPTKNPDLGQVKAHGLLAKPFYFPDLMDTVEHVLKAGPDSSPIVAETPIQKDASEHAGFTASKYSPLAWLQDVSRAAQYLARLTLETAAQAALIVREGKLWAYAGQLQQSAAQELAEKVNHHWVQGSSSTQLDGNIERRSDLARFVRLESTAADYLLYATRLGSGMVLALAFDTETPFSKIRSQASHLAKALASPPAALLDASTPVSFSEAQSGMDTRTIIPGSLETDYPGIEMPSQKPATSEKQPLSDTAPRRIHSKLPGTTPGFPHRLLPLPEVNMQDHLAETKPHFTGDTVHMSAIREGFQPVSPALCSLHYISLLVPRFGRHLLVGDLSQRLAVWMKELCPAFGWRLEHLSIRPELLLWIVAVTPTTSAGYLVRVIRQQTSARIFSEFPALAYENPSGDFWAPGYLVMSGLQPPPPEVIRQFIDRTRQYQGEVRPAGSSTKGN